jgi:mono/diheme cytochrome c family protein
MANDPTVDVQLQLMFSLGESKSPAAETAMLALLEKTVEHPLVRDAAITGLGGREQKFLAQIVARPSWSAKTAGRSDLIRKLAGSIAESRESGRVNELLEMAANTTEVWQTSVILDGVATLIPTRGRAKAVQNPKPVRFPSEPPALVKLASKSDADLQKKLKNIDQLLVWPGKPGYHEVAVKPLTDEEKTRFEAGKVQYTIICGACHQMNGMGLEGLAPPLVDSEWVNGTPDRVVRIVLNGVRGKLNVKGKTWELEMPPLNILPDEDIAGLLTYIRREWGHTASPIAPEFVKKIRAETASRQEAWTEADLLKLK